MKKKALVASILTIALCLSLIAGSTFALFTSESTVNVAVTSGKVDVVATIVTPDDGTNPITYTSTLGEKLAQSSATHEGNTITIDKMVPGDKITFNLKITNNSNVTVKYRTVFTKVADDGLWAGLKVKVGSTDYTDTMASAWTELAPGSDPITVPVEITLPETAGNEYQEKSCKFAYTVEAVQGNAETSDPITAAGLRALLCDESGHLKSEVKLQKSYYLVDEWTPIDEWLNDGSADYPDVVIDGQGHTISNMRVSGGDKIGFIGQTANVDLTIKNLNFDNAQVYTNGQFAGVVIGYQYGNVTLENVNVTNSTVRGSLQERTNGARLGGLVGASLINDSNVTLNLKNCAVSDSVFAGCHTTSALVGMLREYGQTAQAGKWTVENCEVNGCTFYWNQATGSKNYAFTPGIAAQDPAAYTTAPGTTVTNCTDTQLSFTTTAGVYTYINSGAEEINFVSDLDITVRKLGDQPTYAPIKVDKDQGAADVVTLNGTATVTSNHYAIWARKGSKVIINGGTYKSTSTSGDDVLIYANFGSVVEINGGTFISADGAGRMFNLANRSEGGAIIIKGGTFNRDPRTQFEGIDAWGNFQDTSGNPLPGNHGIKIEDGYKVVTIDIDGTTWYQVVPE